MKILFLHNYFHIKSDSGSIMFTEAEILKKNGHEVYFFTTDKKPYYQNNYEHSKYFPEYVDYKNLSIKNFFKKFHKPFYNFEAERKLSAFLNEIKPDIVHNHTSFFYLTPSVLKACYKKRIPVVLTMHGTGYFCPAQTMMKARKVYCKKELCLGGNYSHCVLNQCIDKGVINNIVVPAIYSFYKLNRFYEKVSAFICPSQAMLDISCRSGIEKSKLHLIYSCLNNKIEPDYKNSGYFLYAGNLDRGKSVHYLLEAMSMLSSDIKLHIVGTGRQERELKDKAKKLNLHNVEFKGFMSGEALSEEYRRCIATIFPCNWFENSPMSILESFVYGKPVIASRIGGIPELIENGFNGFIIRPGGVRSIAGAINSLYSDKHRAAKMGQNARSRAEKLYNPELHYKKLLNVYSSLIKDRNLSSNNETNAQINF